MIHLGVEEIVEDYWQQSSALGDVAVELSFLRSTWVWEVHESLWEGLVWEFLLVQVLMRHRQLLD